MTTCLNNILVSERQTKLHAPPMTCWLDNIWSRNVRQNSPFGTIRQLAGHFWSERPSFGKTMLHAACGME